MAIIIGCLLPFNSLAANSSFRSIGSTIASDYSNFYSKESLTRLGIGFLAMGLVANTEIDDNIHEWYQDDVRNSTTEDLAENAKFFGEGIYIIPFSLLSSGLYYLDADSSLGKWGRNTTRAYIVGGPAMLAAQYLTGASRPGEDEDQGSDWKPFNDNNGVSGHAFVGAVPFLTIAKMNDNTFVKVLAYFASTLTAWSRVDDSSHYTSQAVLGWYMAYESVNSVFATDDQERKISFTPVVGNDFYGMFLSMQW